MYDCAFSGIAFICLVSVQNLRFTKKIRYENRKQLAQARPRLRGQFVRMDDAGAGAAVEVLDGGDAPSSAAALDAAVAAGTARLVPEVKPAVCQPSRIPCTQTKMSMINGWPIPQYPAECCLVSW